MSRLYLVLLSFGLFSCSTDSFVPCSEGDDGELCREYRYYNDSPEGFVAFSKVDDSVEVARIHDRFSELQKTIITRFENGKTTIITEQFPDKDSKVQSWHYNEFDSLSTIVYGANDSLIEIIYEDGKRSRKNVFHLNVLQRYLTYRYYQDDGKLYRISAYNSNDSLVAYWNHDYFSTGQNRISYYTSTHQLTGRYVYNFSSADLLLSAKLTNADGEVIEYAEYDYDNSGRLIESRQEKNQGVFKSVFLYY